MNITPLYAPLHSLIFSPIAILKVINALLFRLTALFDKKVQMFDVLWVIGALFLAIHGLIHLMGFFAYWPLAIIPDLPYKTAILAGQLELGATGIQIFSLFWLIPALGFAATSVAMIGRWHHWKPVLFAMTILSFVVTLLDWQVAFRGTLIDLAILIVFLIGSHTTKAIPARGH